MLQKNGFHLYPIADIPYTHRVRFNGLPSKARIFCDDRENGIRLSVVEYPFDSVEPRHVHPGTHATTVVKGRAIIDGLTLGPLDVILGPGGEPHGPLHYPEGCCLFSAFQGSNEHSGVDELSAKRNYRLVQHEKIAWQVDAADGREFKTLVDHGAGRLLLRAVRFAPGASVARHSHPEMQAALIVEGGAQVDGAALGVWDLIYQPPNVEHGPISFPGGATLLVVTMRHGTFD